MDPIAIGLTLAWVALGLGWWLGYQLFLQNGRLLLRLEALERTLEPGSAARHDLPLGLPVGSVLHDFDLPVLGGGRMALSQWRGQQVVLVFVDPRCPFSRQLLAGLAALPPQPADGRPAVLVLTTGSADENRKLFDAHGVRCPVLLQEDGEVASLYWVDGTPMAYLVNEEGRTASRLVAGVEDVLALARGERPDAIGRVGQPASDGAGHLRDLVTRAPRRSRLVRDGLPTGMVAPLFRLPRLDGGELSLEAYRGKRALLVFSDPTCGPCEALAPELEQLHRRARDLHVLVVSRGDPEANRAKVARHELTYPIALQRHWEVSRDYGMFATPIAYLIDEQGFVAADVAIGVDAILGLAAEASGSRQRKGVGLRV